MAFLRALAKRRRRCGTAAESSWRAPADPGRDAERAARRVGEDALCIPRCCDLRRLDGAYAGPGGPTVADSCPGPRCTISWLCLWRRRSTVNRCGPGTARLGDQQCGVSAIR